MSDYANAVSPRKVMETVNRGYQRLRNFRNARVHFIRNGTGPYYDRESGLIGKEPLNLIFNAIRVLVPNIVLNFATHKIKTPYLASKRYCELLELALQQNDRQLDIPTIYRRCIVDAIFTLGIMKTGLCESDSVYAFDEDLKIDPGTIYTANVDFDNYVVDPASKEHLFVDARFEGETLCVPRQKLLDSGLYKNDLIERLPRAGEISRDKKAHELSMRGIQADDNYDLEDEVEIIEIWVPSANAILTIPACNDVYFDDYLRVDDYYGVKEGPYTKLALTPPVPGNPLPVPMVGIWNDLHIKANEMAVKVIEQAARQKDVVGYKGSAADDAEELRAARDGDTIKVEDPSAVQVYSFGGQQPSNEKMIVALQSWFNMMSGNPQQMGGNQQDSDSATGSMILQQNAGIALGDMKDLVYKAGAQEARRRTWYMHTDPLINLPLTKRQMQPAQYAMGPMGPVMAQPPQMQEVQVFLTPEARSGDHLDFQFTIEPESMGRQDSQTRLATGMDFCVKVMPAIVATAQQMMMLGLPFSAKAMLIHMAKLANIDWLEEVLYDPEFQMMMMQQMAMGPQPAPGQATPQGGGMGGGDAMASIMQNGQPGTVQGSSPSPFTQAKQQMQAGANPGQQMQQRGY